VRWIALLLLLVACGPDRYGAYLVVDGRGAIQFDRVEFYFGKELGGDVPTTPRRPLPIDESSIVAKRVFTDADRQALSGPVGSLTYYLPETPVNEHLGRYVAVLAFKGDELVGIGELIDFEVATGEAVFRYQVDLVDAGSQDVERWGRPSIDCVRWTRERDGGPRTVAVVRDGDADCDNFPDADLPNADCLPRTYCDGTNAAACDARVPCVTANGPSACQVGTCSNADGAATACVANVCIDEISCNECDFSGGPEAALECALLLDSTHVDSPIVVNPDFSLCAEPFEVDIVLPLGLDCLTPSIVRVVDWMPTEKFTYAVASVIANTCRLTITPETPGSHFTGVPHILIAIDTPGSPASRSGFFIGITANDGVCQYPATIIPEVRFGSCAQ
jgi:hypothetical protein